MKENKNEELEGSVGCDIVSSVTADLSGEESATPCEENAPIGKWQTLLYRIYRNEPLSEALRILSYTAVIGTVYAFLYNLVVFISVDFMQAIRLMLVCLVPFVIVSVMRRLIDMKRPYEVYRFFDVPPKNKCGKSFPSRHVFSAFVIGTSLAFINPFLGCMLCVIGALLAACRVLLGIHFIRDVVAGALIGIVGGVLGMLITGAFFR